MAQFAVDSTGVSVPRLADARTRVVELWREHFGPNQSTDSGSVDGEIIDIMALLLALVWQGVGASSSNAYLRTSEGVFVDLILDQFARRREDAAPSTASVVFYGTDTTAVGLGALVQTATNGAQFGTDVAAVIGAGDLCWVVRIDTIANNTLYRTTVNAINADYTSDASATLAEVVAGVLAALAADGWTAYDGGEDSAGRSRIVIDGAVALAVTVSANQTAYNAVRVAATCTEDGATAMSAGEAELAVAISGVVDVATTADAELGRDRETDAEFKARHFRTLSANGARSPDAVADRLLELDGVTVARVYENESPVTVAGRPAHSFETIVLGGDDEEVAEVIRQQKPAGIRAFGTTDVVLETASGDPLTIGFTRPTTLYLHLEVTITTGEGWPDGGTPLTTIQEALATYLAAGVLDVGADLYRVALYGTIVAAVPGVAGIAIRTDTTAAPGDAPSFSSADIVVAEDEILAADSSRITVL